MEQYQQQQPRPTHYYTHPVLLSNPKDSLLAHTTMITYTISDGVTTVQASLEITVTNTLDYELRNIGKCLRAGVSQVAVGALDADKLAKLETAGLVSYGDQHRGRLLFFTKEHFNEHLQNLILASPAPEPESPKPTKHKGWTVKTVSVQITPEEAKEREAAAAKILADSIRKKAPPAQT